MFNNLGTYYAQIIKLFFRTDEQIFIQIVGPGTRLGSSGIKRVLEQLILAQTAKVRTDYHHSIMNFYLKKSS